MSASDTAAERMTLLHSADPAVTPQLKVRPRKRLDQRRLVVLGLQLVLLSVIFATWEYASRRELVNPLFVSRPTDIAASLREGLTDGPLLDALRETLHETFVGFGVAAVLGFVTAVALYEWPLLNKVLRPFLTATNNLPRIALAPLFVLWFGLGVTSRVVLIVSLSYFVVTFNTYAGLSNCDRDLLLLAKALGARRVRRFQLFIVPAALPSVFAGLQLALTYAFLGAVVGEMLAGSSGIGAYLALSSATFQTDNFFAALVILLVVATAISGVLHLLEARVLRWRRAEMRGLTGEGT